MASLKIEVVTKKLIKPSNPTSNHLQKLKLALFDQLAPKIYVNILYYYSGEGNGLNGACPKCARLEKSLSEALVRLYPLAGRFSRDDVSIDCSNQGVEFWQARVGCKLSEFLRRGPEIELVDKLLPWEIPPAADLATSPQLVIQVNTFEDGGIVIGVRISHIVADASAMSLFMDLWASTCRDPENKISSTPIAEFPHEIARVFPAMISSPGFDFPNSSAPPADMIVTRRFIVPSALIDKIKKRAAYAMASSERRPSRVLVVLALVWKALMDAAVAKRGFLRDSVLSLAMNLRGKVSTGILKTGHKVFGNFFMSVIVPFVAKEASSNDVNLYDLIVLLTNTIADAGAKIAAASREDLAAMFVNWRKESNRKRDFAAEGLLDVYLCSSWYRALPVYEADFGWGKPMWASTATQPGPGVCLMDSCDDGGSEVWISVRQTEMLPFIQQFYTLVSMSNL